MSWLKFGYTPSGSKFALSLAIFTFYSLTGVLRGLSLMGIQMPIIIVCYILLLASCNKPAQSRIIFITFLLILFDFFFVFMQDAQRFDSVQKAIGFNYSIFVSFFPVLYAASGNLSKIDREKFFHFICILVGFTATTTILGTFVYESPCRELATPDNVDLDRLYKSHNIGGYGFIYFIVLFAPILLKDIIQKYSIIKLALLIVCGFCVLRSEYTTALLLFILGIAIALSIGFKSKTLRLIVVVGIVVLFFSLQDIFNWASSALSDTSYMMSKRFEMITDYDYSDSGNAEDDLGIRIVLYMQSFKAFISRPLFGNLLASQKGILGGHSEILDFLGNGGLFGLFLFIMIIRYLRRNTPLYNINLSDPYIKTTMIVALIIALINTFLTPELYFAILIIPLLVEMELKDNVNKKVIKVAIR